LTDVESPRQMRAQESSNRFFAFHADNA